MYIADYTTSVFGKRKMKSRGKAVIRRTHI